MPLKGTLLFMIAITKCNNNTVIAYYIPEISPDNNRKTTSILSSILSRFIEIICCIYLYIYKVQNRLKSSIILQKFTGYFQLTFSIRAAVALEKLSRNTDQPYVRDADNIYQTLYLRLCHNRQRKYNNLLEQKELHSNSNPIPSSFKESLNYSFNFSTTDITTLLWRQKLFKNVKRNS